MTYRYRFHPRGLVGLIAIAVALVAMSRRTAPVCRLVLVAVAVFMVGIAVAVWLAQHRRAAGLGALRLDGDAVRRVRASGRIAEALPWSELRAIVLDRSSHMLLFQGGNATGIHCNGPSLLGGVGIERFEALLREIPEHTHAGVVERGRAANRSRGSPGASGGGAEAPAA